MYSIRSTLNHRFRSLLTPRLSLSTDALSTIVSRRKAPRPLTVALIGRPNTGKSSLFNRLTHSKMAIVSNVPGTTRDRREQIGNIAGLTINVIDTGGLDDRGAVSSQIQLQVEHAMKCADVILFVLDSRAGVTALDEHFATWIRKRLNAAPTNDMPPASSVFNRVITKQDVILVANKTEGAHLSEAVLDTVSESWKLGFGEPLLISAAHGDGMSDLASSLIAAAKERGIDDGAEEGTSRGRAKRLKLNRKELQKVIANVSGTEGLDQNNQPLISDADTALVAAAPTDLNAAGKVILPLSMRMIQMAIMGKPNVGKSTLLNAIIGEERVITGPTPGLTRDSVHVEWAYGERLFRLVDTAGLTRMRISKKLLLGVSEKRFNKAQQDNMTTAYQRGGKAIGGGGGGRGSAATGAAKSFLPVGARPSISLPGIQLLSPNSDPSQFSYQISEFALISALNALRFAQVVVLVVESGQGNFSKLDLQIARKCLDEGRALVICANKLDLLKEHKMGAAQYIAGVKQHTDRYMREFGDIPVVAVSGTEKRGVEQLLNTVISVHDAWSKRISTGLLNTWLKDVMVSAPNPRSGGKSINVKYITQVKSRPPTFVLSTNVFELPGFFERFLKSRMQAAFQMAGVPLRFIVRKSKGAAVRKSLLKQGKHTRRGIGRGEAFVGPNRKLRKMIKKQKGTLDQRRRRDSRLRRSRKPPNVH